MGHRVYLNKDRPMPNWLRKGEADPDARGVSWKYWRHIWDAQPAWADVRALRAIYAAAERERAFRDVVVDHIVPLRNPLVCGLHVLNNLRIISRLDNQRRSNNVWPDMPERQGDLFENSHADPTEFYLVPKH